MKYKIRNQQLKIISREISRLEKQYANIVYRHIPRQINGEADKLANKALDEYIRNNSKTL
jgi:ribonuclease HI/probable phosphoglycerate mutase